MGENNKRLTAEQLQKELLPPTKKKAGATPGTAPSALNGQPMPSPRPSPPKKKTAKKDPAPKNDGLPSWAKGVPPGIRNKILAERAESAKSLAVESVGESYRRMVTERNGDLRPDDPLYMLGDLLDLVAGVLNGTEKRIAKVVDDATHVRSAAEGLLSKSRRDRNEWQETLGGVADDLKGASAAQKLELERLEEKLDQSIYTQQKLGREVAGLVKLSRTLLIVAVVGFFVVLAGIWFFS